MHKGASLVRTWAGVLTNHPYRLNNVLDQSRKKKTFSYILDFNFLRKIKKTLFYRQSHPLQKGPPKVNPRHR